MRSSALLLLAAASNLPAQAPNERWRSLRTEHFVVSFPANLELLARRAGGEAERAFARLSEKLSPPRTPIDLVISDEQDTSNGQATYYPTNRVVVWVHPPIDNEALRFGDDWLQQVVTHEVTHVFHLDRTRGIWRAAQFIFGRHTATFPNALAPRWLVEGIAVAEESSVGSGGRLNGTELFATLDAVAGERKPTPGRLSISSPYWPAGQIAYFGGAWLVSEAERAGGDSSLRRFIDRAAAFPIPYLWDFHAKKAFGKSFSAIARDATSLGADIAETRAAIRSKAYWDAHAPRWRGDSIYFTASGPRDLAGLFVAHGDDVDRVARRTSTDAFAFQGNHVVYAQLDFTDPYRLYSALYRDGDKIEQSERLDSPDVRADGGIVAVDASAGGARLVILHPATRTRRVFDATVDVQTSAPRWSRRGDRIAAARWSRGGDAEIVVLDTVGHELGVYARARAVQGSPSWDVDDRGIYFTSDRSGRTGVYRISLTGADSGRVTEIARDVYGLYDAEISPDGRSIAAFRPTADGMMLVTLPASSGVQAQSSTLAAGRRDTVVSTSARVKGYSPVRTLLPRYWTPTIETSGRGNTLAGAHSSATDVVGRYSWTADAGWDVETGEFAGSGLLTYRGFGRPVVDIGAGLSRALFVIPQDSQTVRGEVARRSRNLSFTLTWLRPRVRQSFSFAAGADIEFRDLRATPNEFEAQLNPAVLESHRFPSIVAAAGWSNASRSVLAIGPEDGMSLSASARRRWRADDPSVTVAHSIIGSARAYKSIPLWGHTRHAIGARAVYGWAESNGTTLFSVGGVSGTSIEIVPGYSVGDSPRTFFVRGFRPNALSGTRAWSGTAEYRAPLFRVGRGLWPLPLFFERFAIAGFADAGSAWCPVVTEATAVCPVGGTSRRTIASVGGELLMDTALDYDETNRFRLGFAAPVRGRDARTKQATIYFSIGLPF